MSCLLGRHRATIMYLLVKVLFLWSKDVSVVGAKGSRIFEQITLLDKDGSVMKLIGDLDILAVN
uniref:Uncharacterized protein n=1 Tax=Rhizophora mucronata TaxID=61149 RepID=A0A2P2QVW5_RHIMU